MVIKNANSNDRASGLIILSLLLVSCLTVLPLKMLSGLLIHYLLLVMGDFATLFFILRIFFMLSFDFVFGVFLFIDVNFFLNGIK